MLSNQRFKKLICWFFISTLFISALQVTVAGYQADENSWFNIITLNIAEEENEESESEEKESKKEAKDWVPFRQYSRHFAGTLVSGEAQCTLQCQGVMREVLSPPPEFS